jgi:hypothetical protein
MVPNRLTDSALFIMIAGWLVFVFALWQRRGAVIAALIVGLGTGLVACLARLNT